MAEWHLKDARGPDRLLHPSAQAALMAMQALAEKYSNLRNILDLGCGSGLLTLAALELWPQATVLAADISPKAVEDAQANIALAGMANRAEVVRSDRFSHPKLKAQSPYDLLLCNLLAEIHLSIAPEAKECTRPGGFLILSGLLAWLAPPVLDAYGALGFTEEAALSLGEWQAYILRKQ